MGWSDMKQKQSIPVSIANHLVNHGPTVLVSSGSAEKDTIMTLAWQTPASGHPMRIVISVAPQRFSHTLIMHHSAFAVNIPTIDIYRAVLICGALSGRDTDKFKSAGL
jgi:flavin reductase (DIM6/NTAB) family NADH-FMN oxidoreductase RutF